MLVSVRRSQVHVWITGVLAHGLPHPFRGPAGTDDRWGKVPSDSGDQISFGSGSSVCLHPKASSVICGAVVCLAVDSLTASRGRSSLTVGSMAPAYDSCFFWRKSPSQKSAVAACVMDPHIQFKPKTKTLIDQCFCSAPCITASTLRTKKQ